MKNFLAILCFLSMLISCSRGKYYITTASRLSNFENLNELKLDSTYHFYLREVCRNKSSIRSSMVEKNTDTSAIRVEVEYLLISLQHKNVIYISTIPDKFQRYYSSFRFADTLINAYDFSTFYFGKIDSSGQSISFVSNDKRKIMSWDIRPFIDGAYPQKLSLREIAVQHNDVMDNVILVDKALEEPVSFQKQNSFTIIFAKPEKKGADGNFAYLNTLAERKIYFRQHDGGFTIYFLFSKNISGAKDSAIGFDYKRTRYSNALLEQQNANVLAK